MDMVDSSIQERHWQLDAAARSLADDLAGVLPADDVEDALEDINAGEPMIGIAFLLSYARENGVRISNEQADALSLLNLAPIAQSPLDKLMSA